MKNKRLVLILTLMAVLTVGCSKKNDSKINNLKSQNISKNEKVTENLTKEYLKSINYSNLADKDTQQKVKESLENAGIDSNSINLFFKSVNYYNEATQNEGLIKSGFINSNNINPTYDEVAIQKIWDKKNKNFPGFNCRITAFTFMKDYVKVEKPVVKTGEMLFMDVESLKNMPFELFSKNEKDKFVNLFSEIKRLNLI